MVALQQPDWKRVVISLVFLWAGGMSSWELHQKAIAELKKLE
jgi:hypothetical protein